MIVLNKDLSIPLSEISFLAVRAGGPGGQHVNKTSTAIQLQWNIRDSGIPEELIERLINSGDKRISKSGILTIMSQNHRSQHLNKKDAIDRFRELVLSMIHVPKKRIPTKPSKASIEKRLEGKKHRSVRKTLRKNIEQ